MSGHFIMAWARVTYVFLVQSKLLPFEVLSFSCIVIHFLFVQFLALQSFFLIEVLPRSRSLRILTPLPFFFCNQRTKSFTAMARVHLLYWGYHLILQIYLRLQHLGHAIRVIKPFLTCAKAFFLFIAIDDGLIVGRYATNGEFGKSILDASFMESARGGLEPLVPEVEPRRVYALGRFQKASLFFFHQNSIIIKEYLFCDLLETFKKLSQSYLRQISGKQPLESMDNFQLLEIIIMKQSKPKTSRNLLALQFKQKCKQTLKQEPRNFLVSALKDNQLTLDLTLFVPEDIPFFEVLLTLPIDKIVIYIAEASSQKSPSKNKNKDPQALQIKTFSETPKFKDFMSCLGQAIKSNKSVRTVKVQRVFIPVRALKQLSQGVCKSKSLRELAFISCGLTDEHLQQIKKSLATNESLITLNLSRNNLSDIGGMIGHILAEHSRRRNQIVFFLNIRGEAPSDDLSNSGLCEINLQHNQLADKPVIELATCLKSDSWTKCINLRNNSIKTEGVKELALMLKVNSSLISLDLRGNEGLSKEYSRYIYRKLVVNMQKYKQQKELFQKHKDQLNIAESNEITPTKNKELNSNEEVAVKYKSVRDNNFYGRYESKEYTTIAEPQQSAEKNNMTLDRKLKAIPQESKIMRIECATCKEKTIEALRLQKKNLDLELQLRKVKHALLTKNIDISAILPSSNAQNSMLEWLSNRQNNQNDDQLLQRMEQIMLELTRVIETIEEHQNTNVHMSNPLDNPNSFSNTIQLYEKHSHLQDLSKEIEEDRLQAMFEAGASLEHRIDEIDHS